MTATSAPPGAGSPTGSAPGGSAASVPALDLPDTPLRREGTATPVSLRRVAVACAVTAVLAGLLVGLAAFQRAGRLQDAADKARQLVVLTDARSQVAAADAAATRAFLVGGVEDAEGRTAYLDALAAATDDLNAAAASGIGDAGSVASIAEGVGTYRGTIEYARALNRQQNSLGSAYLRSAGADLATQVVDPLDAEIASVRGSIRTNASPVVVALAGLAVLAFLVGFAWGSRELSRLTRRTLNPGVVLGGLLVVVALIGFLLATVGVTSTVDSTVDGALRDTTQIAQARTDVFDARSSLNLALIARGSGATYLQRLEDDMADARTRLANAGSTDRADLQGTLATVAAQLQAARDTDAGGDYPGAVQIATARDSGVGPAFDRFDQDSRQVLDQAAATTEDDLTAGRPWLLTIAGVAVVAGVVGAALAWAGVAQRRKEYL